MISRNRMWAAWCTDVCVAQIQVFSDTIERRILPAFEGIEKEADKIEDDQWKTLGSFASPDCDPASLAEQAFQAGLSHYMDLHNLRQGFLNILATFCYHFFEQQLFYFHRKELLSASEENDQSLFNFAEVKKRLTAHGIAIDSFGAWAKIEELYLVANVAKHADGRAAERLKKLRPEMFSDPDLRNDEHLKWTIEYPPSVFQPLFGQNFYVTVEDLRTYIQAVIDFWLEMARIFGLQQ